MQAGKRTTFVKTMARLTAHAGKRHVISLKGSIHILTINVINGLLPVRSGDMFAPNLMLV